MIQFDHSLLRCPITKEPLSYKKRKEIDFSNSIIHSIELNNKIEHGFVNVSKSYFFPIIEGIILLLPYYGIDLKKGQQDHTKMPFDKERVFRYYDAITYENLEEKSIYADSKKFVDFRDISSDYLHHSFTKASKYVNDNGKYFLDIASGPIGLKEYINLSKNYEIRICIDISFNALLKAQQNLKKQAGIFICGDITNIPLQDNVCDAVVSQHTLYHVPKKEQKKAVEEMHRVAKQGTKIAIVYSWFYHSWLMNITLLPVQIYRILRHFIGKLYVKFFPSKPRLYFYAHSPSWFKKLKFSDQIEFYSWRSLNKQFLKIYIHRWLFGKQILKWVQKMEDRYPKLLGRLGDYPVIVITKK